MPGSKSSYIGGYLVASLHTLVGVWQQVFIHWWVSCSKSSYIGGCLVASLHTLVGVW